MRSVLTTGSSLPDAVPASGFCAGVAADFPRHPKGVSGRPEARGAVFRFGHTRLMADHTIAPAGVSSPSIRAERLFKSLQDHHSRLVRHLGEDATPPVWFLHLPGGDRYQITRIAHDGPFLQVFGTTADTDTADFVLASPESVVISIRSAPELEAIPRGRIGFGPPTGRR